MTYYEYQKEAFNHLWSRYGEGGTLNFLFGKKHPRARKEIILLERETQAILALPCGIHLFTTWFCSRRNSLYIFGVVRIPTFSVQLGTSKAATGEQNEGDLELAEVKGLLSSVIPDFHSS